VRRWKRSGKRCQQKRRGRPGLKPGFLQRCKISEPEAENTYKKAVTRFKDTVLLEKTPDRVPIFLLHLFPSLLYGVTPHECMYDYEKLLSASKRFLQDYKPIIMVPRLLSDPGKFSISLTINCTVGPATGSVRIRSINTWKGVYEGGRISGPDRRPTDFWIRTIARVFGAWEPLTHLTPFPNLWEVVGSPGG